MPLFTQSIVLYLEYTTLKQVDDFSIALCVESGETQ